MKAALQTVAKTSSSAPPSFPPVPGGVLQRKCAHDTPSPIACEAYSVLSSSALPPIVHEVLRSPGQRLDADTRASMEGLLGHDFSQVRVHADPMGAYSAETVNALAYASGRHVVFGQGQYQPQSSAGRQLLGHELAHVVQQREGRFGATPGNSKSSNPGLEREANEIGARASNGNIHASLVKAHERAQDALPRWNGTVVLQRREKPKPPKTTSYPTQRAEDFEPDHAFYELVAHGISYEGGVSGAYKMEGILGEKYLYKACQSAKPETPKADSSSRETKLWNPSLQVRGITPNVPAELEDAFAFMSTQPEIPPPIPQVGGANAPLYYHVLQMKNSDPSDKSTGLMAYSFTPSITGKPKILAFRGTEPSAPDAIADADTRGIGAKSFVEHREEIGNTLSSLRKTPGKVVTVGHSLGGALAQRATAAFPSSVDECVTFNSPGVGPDAVAEYKRQSSKIKDKSLAPKITYYVTRGDIVSTAGGARLPGTAIMMEGNATNRLEAMLENGSIKLAGNSLFTLLGAITVLAKGTLVIPPVTSNLSMAVGTILDLWWSGGLKTLMALGPLLGSLHSQRLLRASQIRPEELNPPSFPWGKSWKPPASSTSKLATQAGSVTKKTVDASTLSVAADEGARSGLARLGIEKDIVMLFALTKPSIEAIMKDPAVLLGLELGTGSLLPFLAQQLQPVLFKLAVVITLAGGMEALIKNALYYKPKPTVPQTAQTYGYTPGQ